MNQQVFGGVNQSLRPARPLQTAMARGEHDTEPATAQLLSEFVVRQRGSEQSTVDDHAHPREHLRSPHQSRGTRGLPAVVVRTFETVPAGDQRMAGRVGTTTLLPSGRPARLRVCPRVA